MFEDLRNSASQSFIEEIPPEEEEAAPVRKQVQRGPFLGMTAPQRFIIALLLFFMVCIMGAFCLLLTESVWLPF